jgi:hypothetical protein
VESRKEEDPREGRLCSMMDMVLKEGRADAQFVTKVSAKWEGFTRTPKPYFVLQNIK